MNHPPPAPPSAGVFSSCTGFVFGQQEQRQQEPEDEAMINDANVLRAKEISEMSPKDRDDLLQEIHGVLNVMNNKEEDMDELIEQFHEYLDKIPHKAAYNQAKLMSPAYVRDRRLCIMAIRAEQYDAKLAAARFVNHFRYKLELFGINALARDITQKDLNEDDLNSMSIGYFQILSDVDRSGRPIVMLAQGFQDFVSQLSHNRVSWYLMMRALQDPDDGDRFQKGGYVGVMYNVDMTNPGQKFLEQAKHGTEFVNSILARYSAIHYCYDDNRLQPSMALFQFAMGKSIRMRFRAHFGSHLECQYALLSFGIPMNLFPINVTGAIQSEAHRKRIDSYRDQEQAQLEQLEAEGEILPRVDDVLLGRGKSYQGFPGNKLFSSIISERRQEFASSSRRDKTRMVKEVVRFIQSQGSGGRFLRQRSDNTERWEVIKDVVARAKASNAFRNTRLGKNAASRSQILSDSSVDENIDETECDCDSMEIG